MKKHLLLILISIIAVLFENNSALSQTLNLQLTASNYNGYNISCFGLQNGTIDLTVSGGTSPYTYSWSNQEVTEDLSNLSSGYYRVVVTDANLVTASAEITLTEPEELRVELNAYTYSNGYNISCYNCYNGSITTTVTGGVSPYSFMWDPSGLTIQNPTSLGAFEHRVVVVDNNQCNRDAGINLVQPERSDWTMFGNTGSSPTNNFIGTTDAVDLSFKTNNVERLRIQSGGNVGVTSLANTENRGVIADNGGILLLAPCLYWYTCGNNLTVNEFIGSKATSLFKDVIFKTNGIEAMRIRDNGTDPDFRVEISHDTPSPSNGLMFRNITTIGDNVNSEIKFADETDEHFAIGNDVGHNGGHNFFIYDNFVNQPFGSLRFIIDEDGKVGIGTTPPTTSGNVQYRLYVEDGISTREIKVIATGWPDYVFDQDYNLMEIKEYANYINLNKRLPGMPSQKDIENNNGFEIGKTQILLLEKIEEQALYIINLQQQIIELEKRLLKLEN